MSALVDHVVQTAFWRVAAAATLSAGVVAGGLATIGAASAQPSSWESSCAQRQVTPGPGDALRMMNCNRQADCQALADRAGRVIFENGCFGVSPSASTAGPERRPERRR